jgi:hypothetical protein
MALNNTPQSGQTLSDTRVPINQNFSVIDTAFQVDHVDYNISGQGQHNKVSFPTQNPVPTPQAGIVQLYSQVSAITGQPELVFTHQLGSSAPLAARIVEFTSAGWANPGWTRLPSGILLKWHSGISMASVSTVTVNLNTDVPGSPNFTTLYSVFNSTTSVSNYNTVVDIQSITGFVVVFGQNGLVNPPSGFTVAYLAIGI